jgi:hypothetical protein
MTSIDALKGERVHSRRIVIESWTAPQGIVVEGRLHDERLRETFSMTGTRRSPGTIHDMILRLQVTGPPLVVAAAEAEMPGVPYGECREILGAVQKMVGLPIVAGFTEKAKRRLGGVRGCAHLTTLLVAMGPAAVQGFWSVRAAKPVSVTPETAAALTHYLIDTCHVWRRDSPRVQDILARAARAEADDGENSNEAM